jgi:hypothetical protein
MPCAYLLDLPLLEYAAALNLQRAAVGGGEGGGAGRNVGRRP